MDEEDFIKGQKNFATAQNKPTQKERASHKKLSPASKLSGIDAELNDAFIALESIFASLDYSSDKGEKLVKHAIALARAYAGEFNVYRVQYGRPYLEGPYLEWVRSLNNTTDALTESPLTKPFSDTDRKPLSEKELKKAIKEFMTPKGDLDFKVIRHRLGVSQSQAAEEFNIPLNTVKAWEQEINSPTGATQLALAAIALRPDFMRQVAALLKTLKK